MKFDWLGVQARPIDEKGKEQEKGWGVLIGGQPYF